MLCSWELVPIVHHSVLREGVESVVRSLSLVEEDSAVVVLQDRLDLRLLFRWLLQDRPDLPFGWFLQDGLDLLLGWFLLDVSDDKIAFSRDVALVLSSMCSISVAAFALAPILLPGWMTVLISPTAPTSTLISTAYSAMIGMIETTELV